MQTLQTQTNGGGAVGVVVLIYLAIVVLLFIVPMWKIYTKAGKPGWASLVPIYNLVVLLRIINKPLWWIVMFIIPLVNIVFLVMTYNELSKAFGKGVGFTIGLLFLPFIFLPMLGYGSARYQYA